MAEALAGKWNVAESTNFDEYLKASGVGFMTRKVAGTVKPVLTITVNGNHITINSASTFKNHTTEFDLGVPYKEETIDGRHFNTTFTWEDGKLVQRQEAIDKGDKPSVITRYIKDGKLYIDMVCEGVTATRVYTKA
uniref:Lipocln_cytosolic_FA-bd_dom domain-containing protein n=1 Tax=Strongyloides venezuelensis TaxID=75913 RepID=A0A0K0FV63_STRVS